LVKTFIKPPGEFRQVGFIQDSHMIARHIHHFHPAAKPFFDAQTVIKLPAGIGQPVILGYEQQSTARQHLWLIAIHRVAINPFYDQPRHMRVEITLGGQFQS
jgi:hypothetical protein